MSDKLKPIGFCFRCEYRAQYWEQGHAPRCECGDTSHSKYGCYMYRPVRPCIVTKDEGDKRSLHAPSFISARAHCSGINYQGDYSSVPLPDGSIVPYWKVDKWHLEINMTDKYKDATFRVKRDSEIWYCYDEREDNINDDNLRVWPFRGVEQKGRGLWKVLKVSLESGCYMAAFIGKSKAYDYSWFENHKYLIPWDCTYDLKLKETKDAASEEVASR